MIDLAESHLFLIKKILEQQVPEYSVWLFGSRVNQTAKEYSDIDLVLQGDAPVNTGRLSQLREVFAASNLPYAVDIVDWHRIDVSFQKIIQQGFVEIQKGR